ncbi:unnamed protein product [Rotaria sp. Silwood2]|nr:unnamed protein product [Rotaria sp. Silwood2]CAF3905076.1 unnamed protein product [Rotaria sp. Silwood2]
MTAQVARWHDLKISFQKRTYLPTGLMSYETNRQSPLRQPLYALNTLFTEEMTILRQLNSSYVDFGEISCIHHAFIHQAIDHPQKLALLLEEQSLSYAETLYYSQHLAANFIGGGVIGHLFERSIEMIIAMMAIWISGGIYMPMSPRDPIVRIKTCIKSTHARLVLVHGYTKHLLSNQSEIIIIDIDKIISCPMMIDENSLTNIRVTPNDISHIVFTSGSTGTPKAVSIAQKFLHLTGIMFKIIQSI